MFPIFAWERAIQGWLANKHVGALTVANLVFGGEGIVQLWAPVAIALTTDLVTTAAALGAFSLAILLEAWLKPTLHRGRPRDSHEDRIPSGDCMAVGIWAPILLGWWAAFPVGLVMWARMARNAHWPLDVVVGAGLGVLWGGGIAWLR
jgi:membrane-associated phospholipid phosphatase